MNKQYDVMWVNEASIENNVRDNNRDIFMFDNDHNIV